MDRHLPACFTTGGGAPMKARTKTTGESGRAAPPRARSSDSEHLAAARTMAAECLLFRARRVSRALTRLYDEALRPVGLQATQLTLLNAIALVEEAGAPTSKLAEVLAMDASTLSRDLRPLEKDGLIRIGRLKEDRRVRRVTLTEAGRAVIARALGPWKKAQAHVVSSLGAELAGELLAGLDAAVTAATESGRARRRSADADRRKTTEHPGA